MCNISYLFLISVCLRYCSAFLHSAWNSTCPGLCLCSISQHAGLDTNEYLTINCSNHKLLDLPEYLPSYAQVVDLSYNKLSLLPQHLLGLFNLSFIDLSYNKLHFSDVQPEPWNLTHLTSLNLESNHIHSLNRDMFKGLPALQHLNLANNNISSIETNTFEGLNDLQTLILRGNLLTFLSTDWLRHLKSLLELDLGSNKITAIGKNAFSGLGSLNKLSADQNSISSLDKMAFVGLRELRTLNLASNQLSDIIGKAFTVMDHLHTLILDDNPIRLLNSKFIANSKLQELSICKMPVLQWIDQSAIYVLPNLETLQLHSNPQLSFIDPQAIIKTPRLMKLYMQDNNLLSLPKKLVSGLPSLRFISFYNNPLHCDCNLRWLGDILLNTSASLIIDNSTKLICRSPAQFAGWELTQATKSLPESCSPLIIPMFNDTYQKQTGGTLTLPCKAIGIPAPSIVWKLPHGQVLENKSNHIRYHYNENGLLQILHIKASDIGTYTCTAINPVGTDSFHTYLHVHNHNVHIMQTAVATNFVTLTWNGTSRTIGSSKYVILYRQAGLRRASYHKVRIAAYMRTYTITNLIPQTMYEFCIGIEVLHKKGVIVLHCIRVRTQNKAFLKRGIQDYSSLAIIVVLCTAVTSIFMICLCVVLVKRHQRRHAYKEPDTGGNRHVSTMSQIPLDNLYQPPSTPLYTSRTSLIPKA